MKLERLVMLRVGFTLLLNLREAKSSSLMRDGSLIWRGKKPVSVMSLANRYSCARELILRAKTKFVEFSSWIGVIDRSCDWARGRDTAIPYRNQTEAARRP